MCDYILIISFCFLVEKNTYFSHKKKRIKLKNQLIFIHLIENRSGTYDDRAAHGRLIFKR